MAKTKLAPLNMAEKPAPPPVVMVPCEICGTEVNKDLSFSFIITMGTTGPPNEVTGRFVPGFWCPAENHYGCSKEHAALAAHACIDEHVVPLHAHKHAEMKAKHYILQAKKIAKAKDTQP